MNCAEKGSVTGNALSAYCRVVLFKSMLLFLSPHRIFKLSNAQQSLGCTQDWVTEVAKHTQNDDVVTIVTVVLN